MRRLEKFLLVCRKLYEDDVTFELPFLEWVGRNDCPTYVKAFARRLDFDTSCRLVFEVMCEFPAQREKSDEAWREFLVPLGKQNALVPASYDVRISTLRAAGERAWPDRTVGAFRSFHFGRGQCASTATALSEFHSLGTTRSGIGNCANGFRCHRRRSGSFRRHVGTGLALSGHGPGAVQISQDASTGACTVSARVNHALTDLALMMSHFDGSDEKPSFRSAGGMFVSFIEDTKWPSSAEGSPELPISFSREQLTALKDDMLNCGPPEEVAEGTVFGPGEYIVHYARHKIIAPILELRIKYGNELFSDLTLYLSKMPEFPTAPIMTVDGIAQEASGVPKEFYKWWGLFVMISEVAEQIWSQAAASSVVPELTPLSQELLRSSSTGHRDARPIWPKSAEELGMRSGPSRCPIATLRY